MGTFILPGADGFLVGVTVDACIPPPLNPLLRYEAFEPKSQGIKAILPCVDDFRTVHNLNSLRQLADVLSQDGPRISANMAKWRERAV